jgi:hypothetical protein
VPDTRTWGLKAAADSGDWHVELLEADDGAHQLVVERPPVYLSIDVSGCPAVTGLVDYFDSEGGGPEGGTYELGRCVGHPVLLVRDDEYPGRHFVKIGAAGTLCEFALAGDEVARIRSVFRQLQLEADRAE